MIIVPILKSWRYSFVNSCHSQMSVKSGKGKRVKVEGVPGKVSDYYFLMQPSLFPIDSLIDCYFIQNGKGKRLARRGTKKWASLSAVIFCIFIMRVACWTAQSSCCSGIRDRNGKPPLFLVWFIEGWWLCSSDSFLTFEWEVMTCGHFVFLVFFSRLLFFKCVLFINWTLFKWLPIYPYSYISIFLYIHIPSQLKVIDLP